jgi:hypothetical protein
MTSGGLVVAELDGDVSVEDAGLDVPPDLDLCRANLDMPAECVLVWECQLYCF